MRIAQPTQRSPRRARPRPIGGPQRALSATAPLVQMPADTRQETPPSWPRAHVRTCTLRRGSVFSVTSFGTFQTEVPGIALSPHAVDCLRTKVPAIVPRGVLGCPCRILRPGGQSREKHPLGSRTRHLEPYTTRPCAAPEHCDSATSKRATRSVGPLGCCEPARHDLSSSCAFGRGNAMARELLNEHSSSPTEMSNQHPFGRENGSEVGQSARDGYCFSTPRPLVSDPQPSFSSQERGVTH